ncbi:MAG: hypothetical protein ABIU63_14150 [Chitinophagaceae bacterium]
MDLELLKKNLHLQIDAIGDASCLQQLLEAAIEYRRLGKRADALPSPHIDNYSDALQQSKDEDWISHDDLMELAKTWPKQ